MRAARLRAVYSSSSRTIDWRDQVQLDDDEVFAFFVSAILAFIATLFWYLPLLRVRSLILSARIRFALLLAPPLCLLILLSVLTRLADHQVRDDWNYIALFLTMGTACLGAANLALTITGVSTRDHAIERRNTPACLVSIAALFSTIICFAGANIGAGATIWTTVGPAAAALFMLFAIWLVHALLSSSSQFITVDRDWPAAIRRAGFYIALGLIFARAVAGDWVSVEQTQADFLHRSWPSLILLLDAVILDHRFRPKYQRTSPRIFAQGYYPAAIYLLVAFADLFIIGRVH